MDDESSAYDQLRQQGAAAVRWALDLELSEPEWDTVDALFDELSAAFDTRDLETIRDVILDLDGLRWPEQREGESPGPPPPVTRTKGIKVVHQLVPPDKSKNDANQDKNTGRR